MVINTELGFTVAKIYYGEVCNNLIPFALYLSFVFCKAKFIVTDIFGSYLTQQRKFPIVIKYVFNR